MNLFANAPHASQVIPRADVAHSGEVKELDRAIDGCYKRWNCYDVLPEVCGLLRSRSDKLAAQHLVRESIASLSLAIIHDPFCGANYSMRGRRYLNCGEFSLACADFALASRLIPENWYVWYHLGAGSVIMGDLDMAEKAFHHCAGIPTTLSLRAALLNWQWIAYMRQGRREDAAALISDVDASWEMDGTGSYLRLLLLYKGVLTPEEAMALPDGPDPIPNVTTQGFGVANYYLVNGDMENYKRTLDRTLETGREEAWMCYGWAAAEYERKRLDN